MEPRTHIAVSLVLVAAAVAGCTAAGTERVGSATTNSTIDATAPSVASLAATSVTLYLTPDLKLTVTPPSAESTVALTTPLNSPVTGEYPKWIGGLPPGLSRVHNVTLRLFVTSSSASVEANALPIFAGLPGMDAQVAVGNTSVVVPVAGRTLVRAGEVAEMTANSAFANGTAALVGTPVRFQGIVYYTHVVGAAEFQYVVGGSAHASRIEFS